MMFLGIDAGKSGGLAVLDDKARPVAHIKMPTLKKEINVCAIQSFVIENNVTYAYIEKQQVRVRQAGGLTIGANYGRILATLELCGVPYTVIEPKAWQKAVHGRVTGDKGRTIAWCNLWNYPVPMTSKRKDAKPHDGVADAWAIAWAGLKGEQ